MDTNLMADALSRDLDRFRLAHENQDQDAMGRIKLRMIDTVLDGSSGPMGARFDQNQAATVVALLISVARDRVGR